MSTADEMEARDVDGLIDRAVRGELGPEEREWLDRWRRASQDNERHHARTVRLIEAARELGRSVPATSAPSAASLVRATGRRRAPRWAAWVPWGIAAAAVLALLLPQPAPPAAETGPIIRTGPAELTTVELEDGSVVRLGPSSRLQLRAFDGERGVALDGLAFFDIAERPDRRFRVRTPVGEAVVLGTKFELQSGKDRVDLVVVEGRVSLMAGGRDVEVGGGHVSAIVDGRVLEPRPLSNPDSVLAWAGTFLVFRSTPLGEAAAEIERVYGARVRVAGSIADRTVTGTFVDQSPREVLTVLCSIGDVRGTFETTGTTITP